MLADLGRGDIIVTGANGHVYPDSNEDVAKVDQSTNPNEPPRFDSYEGGQLVGSSATESYNGNK
jgi:hypothetical protein